VYQFFGGRGGGEIAPVDAAMSPTARQKFLHFEPPTWRELAWLLTVSTSMCSLKKGFTTAERYAVWDAFISWSRRFIDNFRVLDHSI